MFGSRSHFNQHLETQSFAIHLEAQTKSSKHLLGIFDSLSWRSVRFPVGIGGLSYELLWRWACNADFPCLSKNRPLSSARWIFGWSSGLCVWCNFPATQLQARRTGEERVCPRWTVQAEIQLGFWDWYPQFVHPQIFGGTFWSVKVNYFASKWIIS